MPIKLYLDYISQPARAVLAFILFNKIPIQIHELRVFNGDLTKPDFLKVNPMGKIPVLDDNGFIVIESHTIMRYLASTHKVDDHWYPSDSKQRALVDMYLDWHHTNTRRGTYYLLAKRKIDLPSISHKDMDLIKEERLLKESLNHIENFWLKDRKFIASNNDKMSIADLSAFCELKQHEIIETDWSKYPRINEWMKRMMTFDEIKKSHEKFEKLKQIIQSRAAQAQQRPKL